ncbi:MAG: CDP-diacylglycerol--glycerol-3-phosphate 3-phosphatidyltransferase [Actinobacteria bacterium]|uniref:CDP-diacylglycerol--glycerol-3-phosphate 3-phosphatidyltransferase n=1 Tax=Candidatus Fonsibacter lacus TaxID=2576439 RepID=A0A965LL63_9PROT|nr:CDP-diacylglycerol--glycerol-3-phosphate 3-phosphatidyltransferase [Candidatus Fonsibacter lacus]
MLAMFNLPNALTILRILLIPLCFAALMYHSGNDPQWRIIAWWGFFIVGMTDILDGRLARARKQITELGKFLDPVADKLLVGSALTGLSLLGDLPWWITFAILGRELAVTLLRLFVVRLGGRIIPASRGGKLKTFTQGFATGFYVLPLNPSLHTARDIFMYMAIAITLYTGGEYFVKALTAPKAITEDSSR